MMQGCVLIILESRYAPALWGPWAAKSEQAEGLLPGWTGQFFQVRTISYLKAYLTALLGELEGISRLVAP